MLRNLASVALTILTATTSLSALADDAQFSVNKHFVVLSDYGEAYRAARSSRRMLVIYFYRDHDDTALNVYESKILADPAVQAHLDRYVLAAMPISTMGMVGGERIRLLDHAAFSEMNRLPGVAIIDLTDTDSRVYGHVVTIYPLKSGRAFNTHYFAEMLALPPGTLTQRTLIFAVRVHPEAPASADGRLSSILASESESHSRHQASIGVQGHHNWDYRFQRINGRLSGMTAQEVCAESWPGQDLVDAAFECVDSWRQSPGHWSALRSRNHFFGFDMKRGRNGIWYGTGIFARR